MNMWTAIVIIVAISGLVRIFQARHGIAPSHLFGRPGRRSGTNPGDEGTDALLARPDPAAQRELEDLRERVKVLERIVTEERQSQSIAAEIESLRDR